MFFQGTDPVHQTMRRLARRLQRAGIAYAVVGGMAVNAHHHRRTTADVDFLLTATGFHEFRRRFVSRSYTPVPDRPLRFVDRKSQVTIDFLITGMFPGSGDPGPIAYPDPAAAGETVDRIVVLNLVQLIELKLAARRLKDFADVVELIRSNALTAAFVDNLHPSVRGDFLHCLDEREREDLYDARRKPPEEPRQGKYR